MSKPYIVMVEDNPGDVEVFRIALGRRQEPYQLVVLKDGAEALRFIQERRAGADAPEPCVMLLDFHLPKYDGLEVLEAVKREPGLRHVQVIILASGGSLQPHEEAKIRRLDAVFRAKPGTFSEVMELAAEVMELCQRGIPVAS